MWWWSGPGMFFGPLVFIVCIALLLVMMRGWGAPRDNRNRALELLKERFAKGEIDRNEFEERRRVLET